MDFKKIGDLIIEFSYFAVELFPRDPNYGSEAKVGPNFLLKIVGAKSSIVFDLLTLTSFLLQSSPYVQCFLFSMIFYIFKNKSFEKPFFNQNFQVPH